MDRRTFIKTTLAATAQPPRFGAMPQLASAQAGKPATIAFFVKNVTNPFWKACRIGAEKAGKALGVTIETVAPTKPDNIEEQTRLVEDWIVKKPDAFVFVPVDYKALVPSIQKVNKAGIPVIGYNNRMTDVDLVSYIGSDDEVIGVRALQVPVQVDGRKRKGRPYRRRSRRDHRAESQEGLRAGGEGELRHRGSRLTAR